ncbi:HPCL1-like protein [Mya arenaria]|uniref:HPCL1-like protein n=1 Tax=Mya arenaria TaxID=6604 RepID=A0ABY7FQ04_MYAAR|nr:HPCL1-like protein [Mya arenaria]
MGAGKSRLPPQTLSELQANVDVDFTHEEIQQWYHEYLKTTGRYKTRLTREDFQRVYDSVFVGDSRDFVGHLFRTFDLNNDGYVDFKEFIVGLCVSGSERVDRKLGWAFRMYDTDGSGAITREEMTIMLKSQK